MLCVDEMSKEEENLIVGVVADGFSVMRWKVLCLLLGSFMMIIADCKIAEVQCTVVASLESFHPSFTYFPFA